MGIFSSIKLAFFLIVLAALGSAAWYYQWSQAEMQTLRDNETKLKLAVETSEATIAALRSSMQEAVARFNQTNKAFQSAREEGIRLRDKLSKHELGTLAEAKPGLVEKIVNKASDDAARCFEILTGSPLTESERAATKKSETNSSCPEVANPNYVREE